MAPLDESSCRAVVRLFGDGRELLAVEAIVVPCAVALVIEERWPAEPTVGLYAYVAEVERPMVVVRSAS